MWHHFNTLWISVKQLEVRFTHSFNCFWWIFNFSDSRLKLLSFTCLKAATGSAHCSLVRVVRSESGWCCSTVPRSVKLNQACQFSYNRGRSLERKCLRSCNHSSIIVILIFRFSGRSRFKIAIFVSWCLVAFVKHYLSKAWFWFFLIHKNKPSHQHSEANSWLIKYTYWVETQYRLVSKAQVSASVSGFKKSVQTSNEVNCTDVHHRMAQLQITPHPHCPNSQLNASVSDIGLILCNTSLGV